VGGFAIDLPPFTLQAGEEHQPCYVFPLVVDGPSHIVAAGSLSTGPGLHHGNITTRRKTGEGFRKCDNSPGDHVAFDILEGGAVLFASSTQVAGTELAELPRRHGLPRQGRRRGLRDRRPHALPEPDAGGGDGGARATAGTPLAEDGLQQELGAFAWTYSQFHIPPQSDFTVSAECYLQKPMRVVNVLPHMHVLGRRFTAGLLGGPLDGRLFLDADYAARGDSDILQYDPAVDLSQGGAGDGVRFACTWHNTFDKVINEGVGDNEMCILFGYAYPPENAYSALATPQADCLPVLPPPPKVVQ